jgi:hypothetical protein
MASSMYGNFFLKGFDNSTKIDLTTDTIKVALADSTYTPNTQTHDFFDDVTNEEAGTGYTTGGATLANKAWTVSSATVVKFDADDASWATSTITTRYAIIYKSTGTASTSPLIALVDFSTDRSSDGGTFLITWHANGIFTLTY